MSDNTHKLILWLGGAILFVIVVIIITLVLSQEAAAQSANSEATSESSSQTNSNQTASVTAAQDASTSSNVTLNNTAPARTETTVRAAPSVTAPSMSSGHPCLVTGSGGVSIIGSGVTFGGGKVDDACLLAQMGRQAPAIHMIAARNPAACRALRATGDISPDSTCGAEPARRAATEEPARIRCIREGNRVVQIRVVRGVSTAEARAFCRDN